MSDKWIRNDLRLAIYIRDNFTCQHCNKTLADHDILLTLDHIIPRSNGGNNKPSNLVTLCRSCNSRKGAIEPERFFGENYNIIIALAKRDISSLREIGKLLLSKYSKTHILSCIARKESL